MQVPVFSQQYPSKPHCTGDLKADKEEGLYKERSEKDKDVRTMILRTNKHSPPLVCVDILVCQFATNPHNMYSRLS